MPVSPCFSFNRISVWQLYFDVYSVLLSLLVVLVIEEFDDK